MKSVKYYDRIAIFSLILFLLIIVSLGAFFYFKFSSLDKIYSTLSMIFIFSFLVPAVVLNVILGVLPSKLRKAGIDSGVLEKYLHLKFFAPILYFVYFRKLLKKYWKLG